MELQVILMTVIAFSAMLTIFTCLLSPIKENQLELIVDQKEIKSWIGRIESKLNQLIAS